MFTLALHAARKTPADIIAENFSLLAIALLSFGAVIFLIFLLASRTSVKTQEWLKYLVFLVPSILLLVVGLIYPAIRTLILAFMDKEAETFVGFDNFIWAFTIPEVTVVLANTAIWVVTAPILSTVIGLAIAYMTDRMKRPAAIKSLIFMPMITPSMRMQMMRRAWVNPGPKTKWVRTLSRIRATGAGEGEAGGSTAGAALGAGVPVA
jgi:alpha-glucoside transport system permease protein